MQPTNTPNFYILLTRAIAQATFISITSARHSIRRSAHTKCMVQSVAKAVGKCCQVPWQHLPKWVAYSWAIILCSPHSPAERTKNRGFTRMIGAIQWQIRRFQWQISGRYSRNLPLSQISDIQYFTPQEPPFRADRQFFLRKINFTCAKPEGGEAAHTLLLNHDFLHTAIAVFHDVQALGGRFQSPTVCRIT